MVFENRFEGFEKLHIRVDALKVQHGLDKVVFGLEPTANYHKPLADHLIKCGYLVVLVAGARVGRLAGGLQNVADVGLGPLLILVGLVLLDVIRPNLAAGSGLLMRLQERVAQWRGIGAFLLGFLFALAFCPYSAALYFGILIPMAFGSATGLTLPLLFGIGTGMPVLVLGVPLALGLERAATGLNLLGRAELVVRKVAAWTFIAAGLFSLARFVQTLIG